MTKPFIPLQHLLKLGEMVMMMIKHIFDVKVKDFISFDRFIILYIIEETKFLYTSCITFDMYQ